MADTKDNITLEQVRAIMEQMARKQGVCITQVEIKPVQIVLGKGNNGTVGAYVSQVKKEHSNSKAYDRANISMQLKSALMEEIDRFADNARDNANENLEVIERDNQELRDLNDQTEQIADELQQEVETIKATAAAELRKSTDEAVKYQQQLDSSRSTEAQVRSELDACRKELSSSTETIMELSRQNGKYEAETGASRKEVSDLLIEIQEAKNSREEAEQKAVLAEQASALHEKAIGLLENRNSSLENDLLETKTKLSELMSKHDALQEKLDNTNQERINDLQKAVSVQTKTPPKSKNS